MRFMATFFGLAIGHGLTAENLKQTIFAYPTGASDIGSVLQLSRGKARHGNAIDPHLSNLRRGET